MKIVRIVLIFLLGTMIFIAAQEKKKPKLPKVEKKVVEVPGNQAWTDTGFLLRPQDRVTITASGDVCFSSGDEDSCVGPDGYQGEHGVYNEAWPNDYYECDDPLQSENHAALIGEVGNHLFLVGRKTIFSGKNGKLYLGINDCSLTGNYYNTGEFRAVIKVERNAVTIPK